MTAFRPSTLPDADATLRAEAAALAKLLPSKLGRKLRGADKRWTVARAAKEALAVLPEAADGLRAPLRELALRASL